MMSQSHSIYNMSNLLVVGVLALCWAGCAAASALGPRVSTGLFEACELKLSAPSEAVIGERCTTKENNCTFHCLSAIALGVNDHRVSSQIHLGFTRTSTCRLRLRQPSRCCFVCALQGGGVWCDRGSLCGPSGLTGSSLERLPDSRVCRERSHIHTSFVVIDQCCAMTAFIPYMDRVLVRVIDVTLDVRESEVMPVMPPTLLRCSPRWVET
jgi:hypothetical protein